VPAPTSRLSELERLQDRLRVISDAVRAFSETATDYPRVLEAVARNLANVVRDSCVVLMLSPDGQALVPVALHANDPAAEQLLRDVLRDEPLVLPSHPLQRRVVDTGEAALVPNIDPEQLRPSTTERYYQFLKESKLHGFLAVRMRAHGKVLGVLNLSRFRPETPRFDDGDVELAQTLADHAALAISNARSYLAEREARDALAASDEAYRLLFEASPVPMYFVDAEGLGFLQVNEAALRLYGYTREAFLGLTWMNLRPNVEEGQIRAAFRAAGDEDKRGTISQCRKDGSIFEVRYFSRMLTLKGRRGRLAVLEDVTAAHEQEQKIRQSQKMEAIGRLAGGVAHDFNNLLSVIMSYGDMLIAGLPPEHAMRPDLQEIRRAAARAAELTKQLLTFGRQQVLAPRLLDLNQVLSEVEKMLRRILGEDIELVLLPERDLGQVRVDLGSMQQVILNLVVNARDAMPTGGELTLETSNAILGSDYGGGHDGVEPGEYVRITVTDTGTGMDPATLERVFEPFFTTKGAGKGTGLGLATVFGIVRQSGGHIWAYSELGRGSTFKVYLPRVHAEEERRLTPAPSLLAGSETILLVEDEGQIRQVARSILSRYGYRVIDAASGGEALELVERHDGALHLLLTDVVMPHMSGPELAVRLVKRRPGLKVLFMSGYTDDAVVRHGVLEGDVAFLQKPFTPAVLTGKVREVLDDLGQAGARS
jgi:PAS domain S-box-containing protein